MIAVGNIVDNPVESPETLLARLDAMAIPYELYKHRAVFSVADSQDVDAGISGTHTRNLFVRDKRETMFLVTLMAHKKIEMTKLADLLGAKRLSFGSPERLMNNLGVTPGSVTPFSIANDREGKVTLILDAEMMEKEIVNFHPLINTMTVGLTPKDLIKFLDDCGCRYQITDLTQAQGE